MILRRIAAMKFGRYIGWILLVLGLILGFYELLGALQGEDYRAIAVGELWFLLDQAVETNSLNITQAFVQRYVSAWLWEIVIQNFLLAPAWLFLGILGMFLSWIFRGRRRTYGLRQ